MTSSVTSAPSSAVPEKSPTPTRHSFCCNPRFVFAKLFTKEDPVYLHKTLGFLSLISFFYRYVVVYNREGNLGFTGTWFDWATMALHVLLSTSSIIFHVLVKRIPSKPMVIWEEYRLHAIVFTLRSFSVFLVGTLRPFKAGSDAERMFLLPVVLVWHFLADRITDRFGPEDKTSTTIRANPNPSMFIKYVSRAYSFYQFSALGSHLLPNACLADLGFNALIAIQSSAFLMTLFRKGLIAWYTHGAWYSFCLVISLYHMYLNAPGMLFFFKVLVAFTARVQFGVSKYVIWTVFVLASFPAIENAFNERYAETLTEASKYSQFYEPLAQQISGHWVKMSAGLFVGLLGFENMNGNVNIAATRDTVSKVFQDTTDKVATLSETLTRQVSVFTSNSLSSKNASQVQERETVAPEVK